MKDGKILSVCYAPFGSVMESNRDSHADGVPVVYDGLH